MKKTLFTLIIAALCSSTALAQSLPVTHELTLERSIEIAKSQSYSMKSLEQDLIIAENTMEAAIRRLRTNVSLNMTAPNYTENVQQWTDSNGELSYYALKQLRTEANVVVSQPLPTDGTISVETGLSGIDDYNNDMRKVQRIKKMIGLDRRRVARLL